MLQFVQEIISQAQYVCLFMLLLALIWNKRRNLSFLKRIQRSKKISSLLIDDQKIIVAIEIKNLFIECSNRKLKDFMPLQIQTGEILAIKKLKKLFGYGAYYRILHDHSKIKTFLKTINALENVQLYLYTILNKTFTQNILKKLNIEHFFPQEQRRYCQEEDMRLSQKKHPSWVDNQTCRVMIVTPNKEDYDEEDKKYFLLLNRLKKNKMLKSASELIKLIMQKIQSVDQLHSEMEQIKAQIESDFENEGKHLE